MNPTLLTKMMTSMKKELIVILIVIGTLFALPVVAVVSIANIGDTLKALAEGLQMYQGPASTKNTYTFGYCTFWTAKRREEIGKPIPNTWGDAHTWDDGARRDSYVVDHNPAVGVIMESDRGEFGHVAFVEKVDPDGKWTISEMNAPYWNVTTSRTFTAAQAQDYNFIH